MPFVTKLTFQSGDGATLERVVEDIKEAASRKGVELRGPNPEPLVEKRVPQQETLQPGGEEFDPWNYTVYTRTMRIVGHDEFARDVAGDDYPPSIHVEAEVVQSTGASR
jgi:ribosomal protein S10